MLVDTILQEKAGQSLRVEVYTEEGGYKAKYYINNVQSGGQYFPGMEMQDVKEAAINWMNNIEVLKG